MTLADLRTAFEAARAEASASALGVVEDLPPNTCRYCGEYLYQWSGTPIDGHARCIVPLPFQRAVRDLLWSSATITQTQVAAACGVSVAVVSRWIGNVAKKDRTA